MPAPRYIRIPVSVLRSARTLADVDDWVDAHNPAFLAEMRRLHVEEDLAGRGKPLSEILKRKAKASIMAIRTRDFWDPHRLARVRSMKKQTPRIAVFPGSFDPVTNGHVDVIRRGAGLFDELVVGVIENPQKAPLLPLPQRAAIIRQAARRCPNVRVETFAGLTVDFVRRVGASVILRGIRDHSDLQFELQMALTNRVVGGVETVFILPSPEHAFTSSGLIRQIARGGGDVSALVPVEALPAIRRACRAGKAGRSKAIGRE